MESLEPPGCHQPQPGRAGSFWLGPVSFSAPACSPERDGLQPGSGAGVGFPFSPGRENCISEPDSDDIRTRPEVRFVGAVNVAHIQEVADQIAKAHRELDTRIQEMNWQTELH